MGKKEKAMMIRGRGHRERPIVSSKAKMPMGEKKVMGLKGLSVRWVGKEREDFQLGLAIGEKPAPVLSREAGVKKEHGRKE